MKKYYTRACNFFYGSNSSGKVRKKISLPLNGNNLISFDEFLNDDGLFDENKLNEFIINLKEISPETSPLQGNLINYDAWVNFENTIAQNGLESSYFNLINSGLRSTLFDGKTNYHFQNDNADIKFLYFPYTSIPDSLISVSKAELRGYIKNNPNDYSVENSRDLIYVKFDETPSMQDENEITNQLKSLINDKDESIHENSFVKIPKNWKIQKSYYDNLMLNILKDNEIVDKYVIQKRDHNLDKLFSNMIELVNHIKPMINICGEEHIINCDTSLKTYSKITTKNCGELLHYIFLVTIKSLINIDIVMFEALKNIKLTNSTFSDDDIDLPGSLEKTKRKRKSSISVSVPENDVELLEEGSGVLEDISLDLSVERTHAQKLTCNLIYDLLKILQSNQDFYDKHTTRYMNEVIEKKMDSEKEENLKFIEELDKESRQSLKSMITIGFDSWKNLSKKDEKDLYFGEKVGAYKITF